MTENPEENQIKKGKEYLKGRQNIFGFFQLLLEVDKRNNPHLYKKPEIERGQRDD